jgi:hypothetical protein
LQPKAGKAKAGTHFLDLADAPKETTVTGRTQKIFLKPCTR